MKKITTPNTPAERKAAERARKREQGLVLMREMWVTPAQRSRLDAYLTKLERENALLA